MELVDDKRSGMVITRTTKRKGEVSDARMTQLTLAGLESLDDPASIANGALSYMANILVRLTMPHSQVKTADGKPAATFERSYQSLSIAIQAHPRLGLPFGSIPRILMSYITTEAVRTKQPTIMLGDSASAFLAKLGYKNTGGTRGDATRVREQMLRLFSSRISILDDRKDRAANFNMNVATKQVMWWDVKSPDQIALFNSTVELSREFFDEIRSNPVPVDMRALQVLAHSPMALDIYCYCTWRAFFNGGKTSTVDWRALQAQFGSNYPQTAAGLRDFRVAFRQHAKTVCLVYPELKLDLDNSRQARFLPSPTHVPDMSLAKALGKAGKKSA